MKIEEKRLKNAILERRTALFNMPKRIQGEKITKYLLTLPAEELVRIYNDFLSLPFNSGFSKIHKMSEFYSFFSCYGANNLTKLLAESIGKFDYIDDEYFIYDETCSNPLESFDEESIKEYIFELIDLISEDCLIRNDDYGLSVIRRYIDDYKDVEKHLRLVVTKYDLYFKNIFQMAELLGNILEALTDKFETVIVPYGMEIKTHYEPAQIRDTMCSIVRECNSQDLTTRPEVIEDVVVMVHDYTNRSEGLVAEFTEQEIRDVIDSILDSSFTFFDFEKSYENYLEFIKEYGVELKQLGIEPITYPNFN